MAALNETTHGPLRRALGYACLSKGVLAINAGGAATVKTTNAISYLIDGVLLSKAALAAASIAVTHDAFGNAAGGNNLPAYVQPANSTAYLLLCVNAAGTIAVVQGTYAGQAMQYPDLQRTLVGTGNLPQAEPTGYTAFGAIKIATGAATTFTPGTTVLDAAGVTATYFDLAYIPSNLQP